MTRTAERILFLDFDGVLHDENVLFHPKRGIFMNTPGRVLFEWTPILEELLAPYPEVAIVLSTSWVRVRGFSFARSRLSPMLQSRVIGATFHSRYMHPVAFGHLPRGVQVSDDMLRRGPKSWFALDDDDFGWPAWCRDNLIKTNGHMGISEPKTQYAIQEMLKRL
ncbi:hypothetical protein AYR66_01820 [Noviherbaspirillum denitrificans]|uniref:Hydrolase n=2 Tax=Noviherbaspirillum denitrificans TaxID=1968433 RepID=A0A254T679_9BURK|nr:HAD domain-containing protein [Noviherbaspirillum denitrificans]OWW18189.1 hypothetical protein AYR66_01820 [Noviherbaspirillum denitrificans]